MPSVRLGCRTWVQGVYAACERSALSAGAIGTSACVCERSVFCVVLVLDLVWFLPSSVPRRLKQRTRRRQEQLQLNLLQW